MMIKSTSRLLRLFTALCVGGLFTLVTSPAAAAANSDLPDDSAISDAVDDELIGDPAVPAWEIDVACNQGVVTLTGSVDNLLAKDRAQELAATVKGVRAIVNRVDIAAPFAADMDIQQNVRDALLNDRTTEPWEIDASVDSGVVTLTGTVDSWQERTLAATLAKGVTGVRGVTNEIEVDYDIDRSDVDIQQDVASALRWDAYVDDAMLDVAVDDGKVRLAGTVGSLAEKNRAFHKAWVIGVKSVDITGLDVAEWTRDDRFRAGKYEAKSDSALREAIQDAFLYDPRVSAFAIEVSPNNGYVTLRGTVDSLKAKRAAAQDARSIVGVWAVNNRIKVRPHEMSDNRIEDNVENALLSDPYVDRHQIDVTVVNGDVYLYGDVDSTFEKSQADDIAARQVGVREVKNYLEVSVPDITGYQPYVDDWYLYDYDWYTFNHRTTTKPDWQIEANINDELWWSPFVDSDEVEVEVTDGAARLTGTVDTWSERQAATENALEGGAVTVHNDLKVQYGPDTTEN